MISDVAIVLTMIGRDCRPVSRMTVRFMPNPSRITAHWRIFFEVNLIPASKGALILDKERDNHTCQDRDNRSSHNGEHLAQQPGGHRNHKA